MKFTTFTVFFCCCPYRPHYSSCLFVRRSICLSVSTVIWTRKKLYKYQRWCNIIVAVLVVVLWIVVLIQGSDTHQERTRQVNELRWGVLPTSTHLWLLTVRYSDTWWTVISKKAAAVAKTSTITMNKKVVFWRICQLIKSYDYSKTWLYFCFIIHCVKFSIATFSSSQSVKQQPEVTSIYTCCKTKPTLGITDM